MEIRKADVKDIEQIKSLIDRSFDEIISQYHSGAIVNKFKTHNSSDNLRIQLNWKEVYVAVETETVLGTGALANFGTEELPKYSVSNLYVLPELHKGGIGTEILNILYTKAKETATKSLHVPSTKNSIDFYKKYGFIVDEIQLDTDDEITWMSMLL